MKVNKKVVIIVAMILFVALIGLLIFLPRNKLSNTKKVEGLIITDTDISYNDPISILTAQVKNNSNETKEDIKFKITFFDKSKKEITNVTGYLGDLESKETKELTAAISMELNDVFDIKYEILNEN